LKRAIMQVLCKYTNKGWQDAVTRFREIAQMRTRSRRDAADTLTKIYGVGVLQQYDLSVTWLIMIEVFLQTSDDRATRLSTP
jgi:hypothetical protein